MSGPAVRPIFLLSMPRSGSTLVQRVLGAHEDVATASEPWLLLPQVYALRTRGAWAEYGHEMAATAIEDFSEHLPQGRADYLQGLRSFALGLYTKAAAGRPYFLDKTPRYHLIVDELFDLFPDARFVFLWRQPLAVVASMVDTWARGRWNIHRWAVDLFQGLPNLVSAFGSRRSEVHAMRYEDLVEGSDRAWRDLFAFLELSFDPELLARQADVRLTGRWGDTSGAGRHGVSAESLDKWARTLGSPYRKAWCRDYLEWIGDERLATMGYRLEDLRSALGAAHGSPRRLPSDLARSVYGRIYCARNGLQYRG